MYNAENQIDSRQKTLMLETSEGQDAMKCMEEFFHQGLDCLKKNDLEETMNYLWKAIDFGYFRVIGISQG